MIKEYLNYIYKELTIYYLHFKDKIKIKKIYNLDKRPPKMFTHLYKLDFHSSFSQLFIGGVLPRCNANLYLQSASHKITVIMLITNYLIGR